MECSNQNNGVVMDDNIFFLKVLNRALRVLIGLNGFVILWLHPWIESPRANGTSVQRNSKF
jgi:hypothetical protein